MNEQNLIYDWNTVDYEYSRDSSNHPHDVWFDDETLRDGLQSPSALNPTIEQKIELLTYMEKLEIQKVDLGLPGAGPFHLEHIDAMLSHIKENDFKIRPGAAVRTLMHDIEPLVELQSKHEMQIQASAFLGTSPIRQFTEGWTMDKLVATMEKAVSFAVENDIPVMFVTEDTTRSKPEDIKLIYQRAMDLGVRRLCICDTCGHVTPNGVKQLLSFIDEEVIKDGGYQRREIEVNWHGHQDRGLGVVNNIAAFESGADVIHGTALGIEFRIQTPTGRFVDINDYDNALRYITSSYTPSVKFTARETGQHLFRWTFFASGSGVQSSGSIDNFKIEAPLGNLKL